jgi:hypothetical protein
MHMASGAKHLYYGFWNLVNRWREVILVAPGGGVAQIQTLVKRMPDVAEV